MGESAVSRDGIDDAVQKHLLLPSVVVVAAAAAAGHPLGHSVPHRFDEMDAVLFGSPHASHLGGGQ